MVMDPNCTNVCFLLATADSVQTNRAVCPNFGLGAFSVIFLLL